MRIGRKKICGRCAGIGEVAAPATRNQDFSTCLRVVIQQQHAGTTRTRRQGAHQTCRTRPNDDRVVLNVQQTDA